MEGNISQLKAAIDEKLAPLKVAHTRLAQRSQRPNIELTRDPAQYQLVNEVKLIEASISVSNKVFHTFIIFMSPQLGLDCVLENWSVLSCYL